MMWQVVIGEHLTYKKLYDVYVEMLACCDDVKSRLSKAEKDIGNEAIARMAETEALRNQIAKLSDTVAAGDRSLREALEEEAAGRKAADGSLSALVAKEAADRKSADDGLSSGMSDMEKTVAASLNDLNDRLIGEITGSTTSLEGDIREVSDALAEHIADKDNPHEVTLAQIGGVTFEVEPEAVSVAWDGGGAERTVSLDQEAAEIPDVEWKVS